MATFTQYVVSNILQNISISQHIQFLITTYKQKRDAMFFALKAAFPADIVYYLPVSGIFFWLQLPEEIKAKDFCDYAAKNYKVTSIPGDAFSINPEIDSDQYIRLNFSYSTTQQIEQAIFRLGIALKDFRNKIKESK